MWTLFTCCFILTFSLGNVSSASDTDVRNLITELFTTRSYSTLVRPMANQTEPIWVYVEYFLFGITNVDEVEQKLTTTGYLEKVWEDAFLTWTPSSYGDLQYLYIPQRNIWKPDLSLQNGFGNLEELGSKFIQVYITPQGIVLWKPFQIFESKCNINPTYFPFDKQTCHLDFVVWSLDFDDVELLVGSDGITMDQAVESNGQWEVVSSSTNHETESRDTKVQFSIVLKRKPLFVVVNIIIPIILLSLLNIFTFQIPADTGERMGYTITVWLAFAVFLTIVSASLPKNSDSVPILSVYIMVQIGLGTLTVLISAVECRIVSRTEEEPVSSCLRRLALLFRRKSIKPLGSTQVQKLNIDVSWKEGIAALDFLFFCLFFLSLLISTSVVLMTAAFSS